MVDNSAVVPIKLGVVDELATKQTNMESKGLPFRELIG